MWPEAQLALTRREGLHAAREVGVQAQRGRVGLVRYFDPDSIRSRLWYAVDNVSEDE